MTRALTPADLSYLDGLLDPYNAIVSDSGWEVACRIAIHKDARFAGIDPFDVWAEWTAQVSSDLDAA